MKQDYQRFGLLKFGKHLLETGDLDPIYVMLYETEMKRNRLKRWLLAYWWFYHAGVASALSHSQGKAFYASARSLAEKTKTPRGTERRHFRGEKALKAIDWFEKHVPEPNDIMQPFEDGPGHCGDDFGLQEVLAVTSDWPQFGPWIGFKVADMLERVLGIPVKFSRKDLSFYSTPVQGAKLYCEKTNRDYDAWKLTGVVFHCKELFAGFKAPPARDRPIGIQEIETILCKWKSHMGGHYPLWKDTIEIREGLKGWGELADRLALALPKPPKGTHE